MNPEGIFLLHASLAQLILGLFPFRDPLGNVDSENGASSVNALSRSNTRYPIRRSTKIRHTHPTSNRERDTPSKPTKFFSALSLTI